MFRILGKVDPEPFVEVDHATPGLFCLVRAAEFLEQISQKGQHPRQVHPGVHRFGRILH